MNGEHFIERARRQVGVRFRPQGRQPSIGLDCVGLAVIAYQLRSETVGDDYRLSGTGNGAKLKQGLLRDFRRVARTRVRPGDLLLCRPAAGQWHIGIHTGAGTVHADARIGRVVETPGTLPWPIEAVFRRRQRGR